MAISLRSLRKPGAARITSEEQDAQERVGLAYAFAAYTIWGVAPVYFVWVGFAAPLEILAQRIVWALPLLALFVFVGKQWRAISQVNRKNLWALALCSILLSINWLTFIYGISVGRIAETSLGYFINPLISIALGAFLLAERLRPLQWLAVALAAVGVIYELVSEGGLPWIALGLAFSFGFYGLVRKRINVPSALGLGIETLFVAPLALLYLMMFTQELRTPVQLVMLAFGGVVTAVPLVCFAAAAMRLRLTILGVIQYLAPSISLLIAVYVYGEDVSDARWVTFGFVWLAILIFTVEQWRGRPRPVDAIGEEAL